MEKVLRLTDDGIRSYRRIAETPYLRFCSAVQCSADVERRRIRVFFPVYLERKRRSLTCRFLCVSPVGTSYCEAGTPEVRAATRAAVGTAAVSVSDLAASW